MIVLLTDFGKNDIYTGIMKGVIKSISPDSDIIDLTNDIDKFNIKQASFILKNSFKYFPDNSIFLCVVDPEVGSERIPIIVKTDKYYFIAPNNGLLGFIKLRFPDCKIYQIDVNKFQNVSNTFHGRDVFAPVAAKIDLNCQNLKDFQEIELNSFLNLFDFEPKKENNKLIGEIIYFDCYGNAITNFHINDLKDKKIEFMEFYNLKIPLVKTYSDIPKQEILTYIGSQDCLEIAIREGNFAEYVNSQFHQTNHILRLHLF